MRWTNALTSGRLAACLYQMLTGRIAFAGETASDSIAKVLEREPDWSALPAAIPEPIRRLLRRCLDKDPKNRLRDIGDWRIELDAADGSRAVGGRFATLVRRWRWPVAALVALAIAWPVVFWRPVPPNPIEGATFTSLTNWGRRRGGGRALTRWKVRRVSR